MVENKKDVEQLKKSIKKCLCLMEKPLNAEHAHVIVRKTHDIKGGHRLWRIVEEHHQHHLTYNRFTMWKFCIVVHKILHEGHEQVLQDSQTYRERLQKYAQHWWSQKGDHMGECIAWYCQVLLRKLSFHQTYAHFKGNFQYDYEPNMDLNIFFQLCLDCCDYLEDLLYLQRIIFSDLHLNKISAESKKGMCRLAALVTIIAECDLLYRLAVAVLQLLHFQLPPDDISGLSARLSNAIFDELKMFFDHVRNLHLPLDGLQIPQLKPMSAPNPLTAAPSAAAVSQHVHEPSAPPITDFED